jgi:N6-adenosine-specific RNA methylase IME4
VVYADPPWRFVVGSEKGLTRTSAANHYATNDLDTIKALDVDSIAADDAVLFLWATQPMLDQALDVLISWGFHYVSHLVWLKNRVGTGFWVRNKHEILLIGVRGHVPAPPMGTQPESVIEAPVGRHSAKPEKFLEMIERMFPHLPKIELYRRGPARPGWSCWGAEAITNDEGLGQPKPKPSPISSSKGERPTNSG